MEIVQQRLENECDIDLVQTAPNVTYEIIKARWNQNGYPSSAGGARLGRD